MATPMTEPPGSPPFAASPHRLDPPQPSRTPELTSRSLHRIPEGLVRASDVFKSDERFRLDADEDEDWRRNLCSESTGCENRRQSATIKKLMQGVTDTLDWQESADMESEKDTRTDTEREVPFSWTMSKERMECEKQLLHENGRQAQENLWKEDIEAGERKEVDDYSPDDEDYNGTEDRTEDDLRGKQQVLPNTSLVGESRETYATVIVPGQGNDVQSVVTSTAPSRAAGSNDSSNQPSGKRIDPFMSQTFFGDKALHNLLGRCTKTSYWVGPGELVRSGHVSSSRGSISVESTQKEHERIFEKTLINDGKKILRTDTTLVTPNDHLGATSMESTKVRNDATVSPSKQSIDLGKTEEVKTTNSVWLLKDDNLNELLGQSLNLERELLNTGTGGDLNVQRGPPDQVHVERKKNLKTSSPEKVALKQKNQLEVGHSLKSKVESQNATVGRVSGSKAQGMHILPQNADTRRSELNTSSLHGLTMKSNLNVSLSGSKKVSSVQNLRSLTHGNNFEKLIGDSKAINKKRNRKGKSNEEMEDSYLELTGNVATMRPTAGENSVFSASTFEQLQSPTPSKILELHQHLNDLNYQIAEERQQKQLLLQSFAAQNHEFERVSKDKQDLWEGKLRELQKDKYALQIRLQALEVEDPRQKIRRASESVNLTEGELRRLRQEILEQEALIKGYQVENEKAVKRLKDIEATYKERAQLMAEENARLASQLANIQFAGCQTTIYGSTPNASKEIQSLRTELHELQNREATLELELEKARKANQDLGKNIAILNKNSENEMGSLKQMLIKERVEHTQAVKLKEEQTQLYLQSQDAVKTLTVRLEDQAKIIADLRSKVELFESQEEYGKENDRDSRKSIQPQKTWNNIQKAKAMKRIDELEKQVKRLEANSKLRDDHIEDNQQLLASSIQDGEKVKSLQDELMALQQQIKGDNSKSMLQGLRHEHDQLKQEYSRVCALNQQLKNQVRASGENDPSAVKKVKDLEKQVEDIRVFYIKKVRDLTKQLADARKETSKLQTNMEARKAVDKFSFKMSKLEETLASRDAVIKKLQLKIKDLEARKGNISKVPGLYPSMTKNPALLVNSNLQQIYNKAGLSDHGEKSKDYLPSNIRISRCNQNEDNTGVDLADERKLLKPVHLRRDLQNVKDNDLPVAGGEIHTHTPTEVASLRKQLEAAEIAREVLQKTCSETMERAALMSVQHQQMMMSLKEAHALRVAETQNIGQTSTSSKLPTESDLPGRDQELGRQGKFKNHALELDNEALESRVKDMSVELKDHTPRKSPRMAQLQFLRKKIEDMEVRHKTRELEWQRLLHDVQRLPSSKRQDQDELLWQKAFTAKNEEMESFKSEVDMVLEAALAFQRSQMGNDIKKKVARH